MPDSIPQNSPDEHRIRPVYKIIPYVAAWVAALVATDPTLKYFSLAYLFPLGLVAFFSQRLGNDGGWGVLGGVVAIYVIHGVFYFRSRTAVTTIFLFAVLAVLLFCNVAGCRQQLPHH